MSQQSTKRVAGMERRTVLRAGAVAWTAPVIAAAATAPAFAASTTWTVGGVVSVASDTYTAALSFHQGSPPSPTLSLTFTLSGGAVWRTAGNSALGPNPTGWTGTRTSDTVLTYAYVGAAMPPAPASFAPRRQGSGSGTLTIQLFVDGVASGDPIVYTS